MAEDDLAYLVRDPPNAETRLGPTSPEITPVRAFYVRNHFPIPRPPDALVVDGAVERKLRLTSEDLQAMPSRTIAVTLECAGNGRAFLEPPVAGEQWRLGAVSTAEWTGVPLRHVLGLAGPRTGATDVVFVGADAGTPKDLGSRIAFERSLPLADAMADAVLIAYAMSGAPLTPEHGAPLRLIVPGWYGMASVKWLARIRVLERPFIGFFQTDRYVIDGRPVREIRPRALITEPADGAVLRDGPLVVRGFAWCGASEVARVEVSANGGRTWREAALGRPLGRYAWRAWELVLPEAAGELTLLARAIAADGAAQPIEQFRSALGYANNAARPVYVRVE